MGLTSGERMKERIGEKGGDTQLRISSPNRWEVGRKEGERGLT